MRRRSRRSPTPQARNSRARAPAPRRRRRTSSQQSSTLPSTTKSEGQTGDAHGAPGSATFREDSTLTGDTGTDAGGDGASLAPSIETYPSSAARRTLVQLPSSIYDPSPRRCARRLEVTGPEAQRSAAAGGIYNGSRAERATSPPRDGRIAAGDGQASVLAEDAPSAAAAAAAARGARGLGFRV
mmetsp:Transcript_43017/g.134977  ORF Transcript_43017/g.134977 Transcript_43017/m.134977 type:complete len:184 (-) Transcript_43017:29-580(-)